jgi:hypothetical protein
MGKNKNKKVNIKTSKYFTKTCSNCNKEYPSWFVVCPHCQTAWDQEKYEQQKQKGTEIKKDVKIVVNITEENFSEPIKSVLLKFSPNKGKAWYEIEMDEKSDDIYEAEISEVPEETIIIYYIEIELINKEIIIENNNGKYYKYRVSSSKIEKKE